MAAKGLWGEVARSVAALDFPRAWSNYWRQDEFLYVPGFLPRDEVERRLAPEVERLRPSMHRSFMPRFKKSGSVSSRQIAESAPVFLDLYRAPALLGLVEGLAGARLVPCPPGDPHACALYYYTEPGDHIGFHYDYSHYRGLRYTVLLGLVNRSEHCRLVCRLHTRQRGREPEEIEVSTAPGDLVLFNGDKLWHRVTPLGQGEERVVLTLEYLTDPRMSRLRRIWSDLKDSFGYFGIREVVRARSASAARCAHGGEEPEPAGDRGTGP
jgi:hypothetical protein